MTTATLVKKLTGWKSDARLYKLNEAVHYGDDDEDGGATEFVVVSAVVAYSGPETYIFPADEKGKVIDWAEMAGSSRGHMSHEAAIRMAGWDLA